jgi:hypothetical protein
VGDTAPFVREETTGPSTALFVRVESTLPTPVPFVREENTPPTVSHATVSNPSNHILGGLINIRVVTGPHAEPILLGI